MDLLPGARTRAEFERFVADHGPQLLRTGYLITWDLQEAEDLVQECLLRVARRWPRVRRMERPNAYARRILVNLALDASRGRRRRRSELAKPGAAAMTEASGSRPDARLGELELRSELFQALGSLPRRQRLMLVLRYFADLSEAQTAAALGCSTGTVKSTTSRALGRLREEMPSPPATDPPDERARGPERDEQDASP